MYKKVYIEITNNCNLNCKFCIHNSRKKEFMKQDDFMSILNKLKNYTKYVYLHILGEPLMHPEINELIDKASENFFVNITTNGYLINRIKENKNIRQINISLQSFDSSNGKSLKNYMNDIFSVVDNLKQNTYISYRIWVKNENTESILKILKSKYNFEIDETSNKCIKLENNVFLDFHEEFTWPSLDETNISEIGTCYALKDHIGILVDGTVVPCCLDSKGTIKLGNIYQDSLEDIINSRRYQNMLNGFLNNKNVKSFVKNVILSISKLCYNN